MRYRFLLSSVVSLGFLSGAAVAEPLSINPYPEKLPIAPAEVLEADAVESEAPQEELAPLPPLEITPVTRVEQKEPVSEPIPLPKQNVAVAAPKPAAPKIVKRKIVLADNVYIPKPGDAYFNPPSSEELAPVMGEDAISVSEPLSEPIEIDGTGLRPEDTYEPEIQVVEVQPITHVDTPAAPVSAASAPVAPAPVAPRGASAPLEPGQSVPLQEQSRRAAVQVEDQTGDLQVRMSDDFEDLSDTSSEPFNGPYSEPIEISEIKKPQRYEEDVDVVVLDGKPDEVVEQDVAVIRPDNVALPDVSAPGDLEADAMEAAQVAEIESAAAPVETIAWGVQQSSAAEGEFAWYAMPGADVRSILQSWSDEAGVQMIWDSRTEYSILSKFTARGDYTSAVQGLLDQYAQSEVRPVATLHINEQDGQKTLVIRDLDGA